MSEDSSEHFRVFATSLERNIARYEHLSEEDVSVLQKRQIERLVDLEDQWRIAVIRHRNGEKVYKAFVAYICEERKNVLTARPFFRERQPVFTRSISTALKARSWRRLYKFHINWHFISFAMKAAKWKPGSKAAKLAREIAGVRNELVETNLPLAISRSRIFWSRTPKSHLSFMDLTSIATEGLLSAVDKFCLPYSDVFCSVAIGRMVGNFIESYSDTMLHFYPTDRRKIYRANKFLARHSHGSYEAPELVDAVNTPGKGKTKKTSPNKPAPTPEINKRHKTSTSEIENLINAASTVSADTKAPGMVDDVPDNVSRYEAPEECRPDVQFERAEAMSAMLRAASELTMWERKFLRLKGLDIEVESR